MTMVKRSATNFVGRVCDEACVCIADRDDGGVGGEGGGECGRGRKESVMIRC